MHKSPSRNSVAVIALLAGVSLAYCDSDPRVETIMLESGRVIEIPVCTGYVTTVLFPRPVSGIVGYGLTSDPAGEEGSIQYAHPGDSALVTIRVLKPELRVAYMTVLVGDDLFNFALANNPGQAALSVKLIDRQGEMREQPPAGSTLVNTASAQPTPAPQVRDLTKEDVVNNRPVYHPEKLRTLLELAKEAPLLKTSSPDLYQGYEERKVSNVSDYGDVVATVQEVHRFPVDDAIVLFGEIQNRSAHSVTFDSGAITIGIGDRQYPSAFVDCASNVDPETTIKFAVIGQGDLDGGRAHLALGNTFRIQLPNFRPSALPSPTPTPNPDLPHVTTIKRRPLPSHRKAAARPSPSPTKAVKGFSWPWQRAQASPSPSPKSTKRKG
jgi:hypothetical protein